MIIGGTVNLLNTPGTTTTLSFPSLTSSVKVKCTAKIFQGLLARSAFSGVWIVFSFVYIEALPLTAWLSAECSLLFRDVPTIMHILDNAWFQNGWQYHLLPTILSQFFSHLETFFLSL